MPSKTSRYRRWMSPLALWIAAVALPSAATAGEAPEPHSSAEANGAEVYAKVCAYCHETGVGPALLNRNLPPVYVSFMVRNGMRAMPAFRSAEIDDETLEQLVDYVATSSGAQ